MEQTSSTLNILRDYEHQINELRLWTQRYQQRLNMLKQRSLIFVVSCNHASSQKVVKYLMMQEAHPRVQPQAFRKKPASNQGINQRILFAAPSVQLALDGTNCQLAYAHIEKVGRAIPCQLQLQKMKMEIAMRRSRQPASVLILVSRRDLEEENFETMIAAVELIESCFCESQKLVAVDCEDFDQEQVMNGLEKLNQRLKADSPIHRLPKWMQIRFDSSRFDAKKFNKEMELIFGAPAAEITGITIDAYSKFLLRLKPLMEQFQPYCKRIISACNMTRIKICLRYSHLQTHEFQLLKFMNTVCLGNENDITAIIEMRKKERQMIEKQNNNDHIQRLRIQSADFEDGGGIVEIDERFHPFIDLRTNMSANVQRSVREIRMEEGVFKAKYQCNLITPDTYVELEFISTDTFEADIKRLDSDIKLLELQKQIVKGMKDEYPKLAEHQTRVRQTKQNLAVAHEEFIRRGEKLFCLILPSIYQRSLIYGALELLNLRDIGLPVISELLNHPVISEKFAKENQLHLCAYDHHVVETPMRLGCGCYVDKLCDQVKRQNRLETICYKCTFDSRQRPAQIDEKEIHKYHQLLPQALEL